MSSDPSLFSPYGNKCTSLKDYTVNTCISMKSSITRLAAQKKSKMNKVQSGQVANRWNELSKIIKSTPKKPLKTQNSGEEHLETSECSDEQAPIDNGMKNAHHMNLAIDM